MSALLKSNLSSVGPTSLSSHFDTFDDFTLASLYVKHKATEEGALRRPKAAEKGAKFSIPCHQQYLAHVGAMSSVISWEVSLFHYTYALTEFSTVGQVVRPKASILPSEAESTRMSSTTSRSTVSRMRSNRCGDTISTVDLGRQRAIERSIPSSKSRTAHDCSVLGRSRRVCLCVRARVH